MSYFDPKLCTEIIVDASPVGLGCVLVQKESDIDNEYVRVIAYASRLLSDVESRSQIEREALAVCWAIERFHLYLYGKTNPADYMSMHPIEMQNVHSDKVTEEYVNYVCENTCPKAIKLCEIKSASENDSVIQNVIKCLQNNLWYKYKDCEEMSIFAKIASERGNRIVIPVCLRRKIVDIAHEGHMGMSKTKSLLTEKIWFPGMDAMVENVVKSCAACASVVKDERMLPLSMSFPEVVKTDNGPPWQSYQFRRFMELCGIRHRKITPLWPRANAQSENFMKPLGKAIKTATVEGKFWKQEMYKFLRNYGACPHVTTGRPPAELSYGTNIKVLLPEVIVPTVDNDLRDRDCFHKAKQKMYADARNCLKPTEQIHVGDSVIMRQNRSNKLSSAYRPEPMDVINVKGSMITAQSPNIGSKTRNASLFKKVNDCTFRKRFTNITGADVLHDNDISDDTANLNVDNETADPIAESPPSVPSVRDRPRRCPKVPSRFKDFHMGRITVLTA
uniref:uncharacterized protein LOC120337496 n=1 Tax=Styela clava TaxID=7725 RepID=UPI001939AD12|nr:uncharacterized protein LOC120337496 [Styela clava]